jgi:hypothetical protein
MALLERVLSVQSACLLQKVLQSEMQVKHSRIYFLRETSFKCHRRRDHPTSDEHLSGS